MYNSTSLPLVSIIMPTYNRDQFINEAIESIQEQTYHNWELIIIDDGSNDNTEKIVKDIADKRIHYYKQDHFGMEEARKKGLEKARGLFIGFMDSDDLWVKEKLEKQISLFEESPEISFCLTGGFEFKIPNEPIVFFYKQKSGIKSGDLFLPFFKSEVVAATPTLIFKRDCLRTSPFPKNIELAHIHFILSLTKNFKGAILYEALFGRRLHQTNYSTINHAKRHHDGINLIKHYKKHLPRKVFTEALLKSHINFGEVCLQNKKRLKAMREFFEAWKQQPLNIVPAKKMAKAILTFYK